MKPCCQRTQHICYMEFPGFWVALLSEQFVIIGAIEIGTKFMCNGMAISKPKIAVNKYLTLRLRCLTIAIGFTLYIRVVSSVRFCSILRV